MIASCSIRYTLISSQIPRLNERDLLPCILPGLLQLDRPPRARARAQDELAFPRHLLTHEGLVADGAGEAGVGGAPVVVAQGDALGLGVDVLAARQARLK